MTTWLTRITTSAASREVARDTGDMTELHRTVMRMFPDGLGDRARAGSGVLFRCEQVRDASTVLVQSTLQPDPGRLPAGYGTAMVRQLDPLLDALMPGQRVHYRLVANASRKLGRNTRQGKPLSIVPLFGADAEEWWIRQAEQAGLAPVLVTAETLGSAAFHRPASAPRGGGTAASADHATGGGRVRVRQVQTRFEGTAVVHDPALLKEKVLSGIGRGKSHGCGLLSIAPAR